MAEVVEERSALKQIIFGVSITGGKGRGSTKIGQVGPCSGWGLLIFDIQVLKCNNVCPALEPTAFNE